MIDHLTLTVPDAARAKAFYTQALAPLGYGPVMSFENYSGFGEPRKPVLWIKDGPAPQAPMHLAFVAKSRGAVDAFYRAALAAGATDDGPPGIRAQYHPHFYGTFVIDLDGHHIEAVCHANPSAAKVSAKASAPKASKKASKKAAKKPVKKASKKKPAARAAKKTAKRKKRR